MAFLHILFVKMTDFSIADQSKSRVFEDIEEEKSIFGNTCTEMFDFY